MPLARWLTYAGDNAEANTQREVRAIGHQVARRPESRSALSTRNIIR